jgi:hypothetical protein
MHDAPSLAVAPQDAVIVEAEDAGDRVAELGRQRNRPGPRVEIAQLGMAVIEQLDPEGSGNILDGAGQPHPGRGGLVLGDDQVMGDGEFFDLLHRSRVGAVLSGELIARHVAAVFRLAVVEGGQVGELLVPPHPHRHFKPLIGIGPSLRDRARRQVMHTAGEFAAMSSGIGHDVISL